MGGSSGSQQTQQSQQSSPWAPSQPLLNNILGQLGQVNTAVTPIQQQALQQVQSNAQGLPNLGPQAAGLSSQLLGGLPNLNQMQQGNLQSLQNTLSPYTNQNYLNPSTNPYTGAALNTLNQDITNQIGGMFAGAGQSMNPMEAQAIARGLGQGESGVLMTQYNQNVGAQQGAAGALYGAGNQTAQNLLGNAGTGIQTAGSIPGLTNMSPLSSLAASNAAYSLPLSQLGGVLGMTLPIAGLGGQVQSQGTSNTQYNPSLLSQMNQGILGASMLFG